MNKRVLAIVSVVAVLVIGGVAYLLVAGSNGGGSQTRTQPVDRPPAGGAPNAAEQPLPKGAYVEYRDGIIAETTGTKLLFFHAPWCPQCRALEADITAAGVPNGVTIIKVDYDSNQVLRQRYGVTLQTTVVKIDDSGNEVKKFVAYDDPSLAAVTKELL